MSVDLKTLRQSMKFPDDGKMAAGHDGDWNQVFKHEKQDSRSHVHSAGREFSHTGKVYAVVGRNSQSVEIQNGGSKPG